ncbi:hypothetical protein LEN26_019402 [Aphanomyces euteiches]|nr:hypothetical protein LEN26_019402 [Aphanomyces euteiches]KAH9195628.1 hypothetical protein AeNC1_002412 [Aphanomyces euteiches]
MSSKIDALKRYMGGPAVPEEKLKKKRKKKKSDGGLGMFVIDDDDAWDSAVAAQGKQKDLWHDEKSAYNEDLPTIVDGTDYDPENQPVVANAEEFFEQERAEELEKQWQATETKVPSDPSPPRKNRQTDASSPRKSKREPASPNMTHHHLAGHLFEMQTILLPEGNVKMMPHHHEDLIRKTHPRHDDIVKKTPLLLDEVARRIPHRPGDLARMILLHHGVHARKSPHHLVEDKNTSRHLDDHVEMTLRRAGPNVTPHLLGVPERETGRHLVESLDMTTIHLHVDQRFHLLNGLKRSVRTIRHLDDPDATMLLPLVGLSALARHRLADRDTTDTLRLSKGTRLVDLDKTQVHDVALKLMISDEEPLHHLAVRPNSMLHQRRHRTNGSRLLQLFKEQQERHREEQNAMFKNEELMGKQAETVYRDKRGRKLDMLMEMQRQQEIQDGKRKREAKEEYEWGTGKVRKEEIRTQQQELEAIKSKPFARRNDDAELEALRKAKQRDFDPVQSSLFKKDDFEEKLKPAPRKNQKPKYTGPPAPPNRFNIPPGYRWDGVVRGTNWEEKVLLQANARKAHKQDMYQWATADM